MVAILFLLAVAVRLSAWADEPPQGPAPAPFNATAARPAQDEAVEQLLDQAASIDIREMTLDGLTAFLRERKIEPVLDHKALEEAGVGSDTPLRSLKLSDVSLASVLDLLLAPLDLTHVVQDGKLLVTTTDVASNLIVVKVYRVDDLVRTKDGDGEDTYDNDSLIELVTTTIDPDTWDEVGGPGPIRAYQGTLVIGQTQRMHAKITRLLAALRESRAKQDAGAAPETIWIDSAAQLAARRKFVEKSNTAADFKFAGEKLENAITAIAGRFALQAVLDLKALEEAGIGSDTPVTADLRQVTLPVALVLLLGPLDLTHVIKDEVVLITTTDVASNLLSVGVYPVADLVQSGPPKVGAPRQDFDSLVELISGNVKPDTWDQVGGPASVKPFPSTSSLVIAQRQDVHDEIERLLAGLRKLRAPLPKEQAAAHARTGPQVLANVNDSMIIRFYPLVPNVKGRVVAEAVRAIAPQSWEKQGANIQASKGMLTVRNTSGVQLQVQKFLIESGAVNLPDGGRRGGMGGMGGGMF
jgi:hypothetical protein